MKIHWSDNFRWYVLVGGLVVTLALLVVLQYRSVKAVGETMREQMRTNLRGSLMDVRQAFEREFRPLCRELELGPSPKGDLSEVALRFNRWQTVATHPSLVAAVYVFEPNRNSGSDLVKLNPSGTVFESASWPEKLITLKTRLTEMGDAPAPPDDRNAGGTRAGDHHGGGSMRRSPWMIDQDVPALVHPIHARSVREADERRDFSIRWLIIVLDRTVLGQHILPEEIQRYFGTNDQSSYEIAVIDKNVRAPDLYVSNPKLAGAGFRAPDITLNLFGRPTPSLTPGEPTSISIFIPIGTNPRVDPVRPGGPSGADATPDEGPPSLIIQPIHYALGQEWEIVAKHRLGSVDAAVTALSRRNLMFNLGVLAVLAATMAMIIVASMRARRLGQLQMDFVANVSHELRTPLTGIVSAGQNMADGLVDDNQKVTIYGKAIVREAQQLSELVELILQFSATQNNGARYRVQLIDVAEAVQLALKNTSPLILSAGFTIEPQIEPGLPPVSADCSALARCLQNLIGNAVKYGGDHRWIGIRAWMAKGSNGGKEMCISVADRGIGIRPEDIGHIFEPFYRASDVADAQIHGTGLGLPLARKIAQAMGGTISVASEFGKGSTFTVHLPLN